VGFDGDYFGSKEVAGLFRSDRVRMSIDYCSRPIFTTIRGMDGGGDPRDPRDILPVWFHYGG
jgi:hypothetical protein